MRIETLILIWIGATLSLGLAKTALASSHFMRLCDAPATILPYLLIALAPIAGYRIAAGSFPCGFLSAQPELRLCRFGTWRQLDPIAARENIAFGPTGFVASLLAGILLNVPFKSFEFILSIPAVTPNAPGWAQNLMIAMTLDVVTMNFFYMVCFFMVLRSIPLFPRMLIFAWGMDLAMQFTIIHFVTAARDLPASVSSALEPLLVGNLKKVMISAFVWLPYLILSDRANVTFRQRVRG
jgi:hypothetical protein